MPNNVKHFSINADDVPRARKFYESAFGWHFTPWGPPGFYLIKTGTDDDPGLEGALQGRRQIVEGKPIYGFECSLGVASIIPTRTQEPSVLLAQADAALRQAKQLGRNRVRGGGPTNTR